MDIIKSDMENIFSKINAHFFYGKSILLTGANGLIGNYMLIFFEFLNAEYNFDLEINIVTRSKILNRQTLVNTNRYEGDLTQQTFIEKLPNVDLIIHAAGYAQPDKFLKDPFNSIILNSQTLILLLDKLNIGGRLLYFSSSEVYSGLKNRYFAETQIGLTTPQHVRSSYIEAKRIGETICKSFNEINYATQKSALVIRLSTVYGPGYKKNDPRVLNKFIEDAVENKIIKLADKGKNKRTFCYLSDAIEMCLEVLIHGIDNVYNVGNLEFISIKKLAKLIGKLTGSKIIIPRKEIQEKLGAQHSVRLNIDKVLKLNNKTSFVTIREGIIKTLQWRKNVSL